jgi:hypothetical protein
LLLSPLQLVVLAPALALLLLPQPQLLLPCQLLCPSFCCCRWLPLLQASH